MFSLDLYGNITATVGDSILLDFVLRGNDNLENDDKVQLGVTFNDVYKTYEYTPIENKVKFQGEANEKGKGTYSIRVLKKDGRQETTNIGTITVN